jgi:hypothetical protein
MSDAIEKVFLCHRAQILRAVGAPIRKLSGSLSGDELTGDFHSRAEGHRMAIGACFVFRRKFSRSVFWDFFDSIDPELTLNIAEARTPPSCRH